MTAGRRAQKAGRKPASARAAAPRGKAKAGAAPGPSTNASDNALKTRLAVLERERDALRADLDRAQTRLKALEKTQADVRDRIAWALDSLHNLLDGKG